jgi:8-oxo-dGTP diphosphatase
LEHQAARWLGKGELYSVEWLPADVGIIPLVEKIL